MQHMQAVRHIAGGTPATPSAAAADPACRSVRAHMPGPAAAAPPRCVPWLQHRRSSPAQACRLAALLECSQQGRGCLAGAAPTRTVHRRCTAGLQPSGSSAVTTAQSYRSSLVALCWLKSTERGDSLSHLLTAGAPTKVYSKMAAAHRKSRFPRPAPLLPFSKALWCTDALGTSSGLSGWSCDFFHTSPGHAYADRF